MYFLRNILRNVRIPMPDRFPQKRYLIRRTSQMVISFIARNWQYAQSATGWRTLILAPFLALFVTTACILFVLATMFYLDAQLSAPALAAYIFYGLAAIIVFLVSILITPSNKVVRFIVTAIELYLAGMVADLLSQVDIHTKIQSIINLIH